MVQQSAGRSMSSVAMPDGHKMQPFFTLGKSHLAPKYLKVKGYITIYYPGNKNPPPYVFNGLAK